MTRRCAKYTRRWQIRKPITASTSVLPRSPLSQHLSHVSSCLLEGVTPFLSSQTNFLTTSTYAGQLGLQLSRTLYYAINDLDNRPGPTHIDATMGRDISHYCHFSASNLDRGPHIPVRPAQ